MLAAAGIGPGDEVIIPDYTFVSTALAVSYLGARPVFIDVDRTTWNIDLKLVEKAITPKTKAIIPVDIYGLPADMPKILALAKKNNLLVLEDAAEALGAEINGQKVGTETHAAIFSFYGNKTITTGEGGMLVTNSKKIYERAKTLKEYGRDSKNRYISNLVGFNYRMTNLQAAIGLGQLQRIKSVVKRKKEILNLYKNGLKSVSGVIFQEIPRGISPSAWLISLVINPKLFGLNKNELALKLNKAGIDTRIFFPPLHRQPIYQVKRHPDPERAKRVGEEGSRWDNKINSFPVSDYLYANGLSLPSFPTLKNSEIKYICSIIKKSKGKRQNSRLQVKS